jgi:hypothetical protein
MRWRAGCCLSTLASRCRWEEQQEQQKQAAHTLGVLVLQPRPNGVTPEAPEAPTQ